MENPTRTVELGKWFSGNVMPDWCRSRLFVILMGLAFPVVEHYRGDIYHDALFLSGVDLHDGDALFYGFDTWGTHIGEDKELAHEYRGANVYQILIVNDDGIWNAEITEVTR